MILDTQLFRQVRLTVHSRFLFGHKIKRHLVNVITTTLGLSIVVQPHKMNQVIIFCQLYDLH